MSATPGQIEAFELQKQLVFRVLDDIGAGDPDWDTFTFLTSVEPDVTDYRVWSYRDGQRPRPFPLTATDVFALIAEIHRLTRVPDQDPWRVMVVKLHRDSAQVVATYFYGADADRFTVTADTLAQVSESLRPTAADFEQS